MAFTGWYAIDRAAPLVTPVALCFVLPVDRFALFVSAPLVGRPAWAGAGCALVSLYAPKESHSVVGSARGRIATVQRASQMARPVSSLSAISQT